MNSMSSWRNVGKERGKYLLDSEEMRGILREEGMGRGAEIEGPYM